LAARTLAAGAPRRRGNRRAPLRDAAASPPSGGPQRRGGGALQVRSAPNGRVAPALLESLPLCANTGKWSNVDKR